MRRGGHRYPRPGGEAWRRKVCACSESVLSRYRIEIRRPGGRRRSEFVGNGRASAGGLRGRPVVVVAGALLDDREQRDVVLLEDRLAFRMLARVYGVEDMS